MFRARDLSLLCFLTTCLTLAACASSPPAGEPRAAARADGFAARDIKLPSGTTLKVAADWTEIAREDGVTLEGPEKVLQLDIVEIRESPDLATAIAEAWKKRYPTFNREQVSAADSPGREGWETFHRIDYKTSPKENRSVAAIAAKLGTLAVVTLIDMPLDALQRRISQVLVVPDSLRPPGYERELYTGRVPKPLDETKIAELRAFINDALETADVPGASVILFDTERTYLEEGFGVRRRGGDKKVTPDTLFIIASNTKPLTTLLLAKLVDEEKLTWETPVTEVYPDFKLGDAETSKRVLVKHLICACTGLPRQDFEWLFTFTESSPAKQLEVLATMQPTTDFGELYQYSNPLASAAGYVGAHVLKPDLELGQAYDEAMQERIFAPLGMSRTTFSFEEAMKTDYASPHAYDMNLQNVPIAMDMNLSILPVRPAGGAWSSVRDYAKVVRMELASGRLPDGSRFVSKEALLARRKAQVRIGEESWYGMGLWLEDLKGIRVISHGGSMFGYKSDFFLVPELGLGGVVLTNADSGYAVARAIKRRVLEMVYDGKPEAAEDLAAAIVQIKTYLRGEQKDWRVPPDEKAVERLAGAYQSPALGTIKVVRQQKRLFFELDAFRSEMATKLNPDGSTSFLTIEPAMRGLELAAPAGNETIATLTLRDPQHVYPFEAVE